MPTFDKNKQYGLENGWEYRNYCDDGGGDYPIHGAFRESKDKCWSIILHNKNLEDNSGVPGFDLVEISLYEDFKKR